MVIGSQWVISPTYKWLGGGFKYLLFSFLFGDMLQIDEYFWDGWFNHQPDGIYQGYNNPLILTNHWSDHFLSNKGHPSTFGAFGPSFFQAKRFGASQRHWCHQRFLPPLRWRWSQQHQAVEYKKTPKKTDSKIYLEFIYTVYIYICIHIYIYIVSM